MITHVCLGCGKVTGVVESAESGVSHGYCSECEELAEINAHRDFAAETGEYGPAIAALAHPWRTVRANWLALCALAYLVAQIVRAHKFFGF